jgi:3-mercaptopyruvate sulfurtransferase SseA
MVNILTFVTAVALLFCPAAFALERFDIITTEEMKQMLEDRAAGIADFVLVNALDEIVYRDSSIPGSVNVPWSKVDETAYRLGDDKNKLIVTY